MECSQGTGAACGSLNLKQGFQSLLRRRFGEHANSILTDRRVDTLRKFFEC